MTSKSSSVEDSKSGSGEDFIEDSFNDSSQEKLLTLSSEGESSDDESSDMEKKFGEGNNILNSTTIISSQVQITPQAKKHHLKRMLDRSQDTPRLIKKPQELNTPKPAFKIEPNEIETLINTPRNVTRIESRSPSPNSVDSVIPLDNTDDVINVSSEAELEAKSPKKWMVQPKLESFFVKNTNANEVKTNNAIKKEVVNVSPIKVSITEYNFQREKIRRLEMDLSKAENWMRTINLEHLPDRGQSLKDKHASIANTLAKAVESFSRLEVAEEHETSDNVIAWEDLERDAELVQPKTFGKQALNTYNTQKALTMERLQELHSSLESCPLETDLTDAPKGLTVELMQHQKRALTWLMWREKKIPSGGILADDMGLGKTLTMISLMMKTNELEEELDSDNDDGDNDDEQHSYKYKGGTLVVCPASLINQWADEVTRRTKRGLISFEMYHGPKRETKAKKLARYDMVITTYAIIGKEGSGESKNTAIFQIKWRRIILDEAHQIRNYKSKASVAVCQLPSKSRWALTGTPVHNKEMDMYALIKFLKCPPFNELPVWKRWVGDKSQGGQERLHTLISSLMLRRTKAELIKKGSLQSMPERKWELVNVKLTKNEFDIYNRILIFSRTLFAQFLSQRAEKNEENITEEMFRMRKHLLKSNNIREVKQHDILVLLLRLRQICCHPSLIVGMLKNEDVEDLDLVDTEAMNQENINFLEQLENLKLDENYDTATAATEIADVEECRLNEAVKGILNPSNPLFAKERMSSKIEIILKILKEKVVDAGDKAILVSQWSSYLKLIAIHLKNAGIIYEQLDGSVPVSKRMEIVNKINNSSDKTVVLLLSLTAGGVGLNLVGANHLFLLDLHWNPQLENQAQDRIYRMGQKKPVYVYKFLATDTIENRILNLQEQKLKIADSMMTGSKQAISSKLSLQDLKMLFEMK